jgi:hypothetical protein
VDLSGLRSWQCARCDHRLPLTGSPNGTLQSCLVCGNHEIYRKKEFPHRLGITILTLAILASLVPYYLRYILATWAILIGSAVFDGVLYLLVGDVSVCYRCGAEYRGFASNPQHKPFELGVGERYRQEKLRREQLRAEAGRAQGEPGASAPGAHSPGAHSPGAHSRGAASGG